MRGLAVAFALTILCACNPSVQSSSSPSPSPSPTSSGLSLKISGHGTAQQPVRFVAQQKSRIQYDLRASSFESVGAQGSARVSFRHVRVTFYGKDGSHLVADAPQAIVDQTTNTIQMLGGVRAKNDNGTSLSCDTLQYDHQTEMLFGTGHVIIASARGFKATGDRFESDISMTHTRMQ
ncbi:MAG TPA: LPS export ABC transporter periplasmic protein LptC [Candidatus Acidoferrales bacterium]|nr:LPS export ABC transporter periplasmic protein LptC [Candidatus Acidoferrales bacterium]